MEPGGCVWLPAAARRALGAGGAGATVRAVSRGAVLVVRPGGTGAPVTVDGRGRVSLPVWWRRACAGGAVAVAARAGEDPLVVLAPTRVLDGLADVLVGERR